MSMSQSHSPFTRRKKYFPKKSYDYKTFQKDIKKIMSNKKDIKEAFENLPKAFIEKIMLACTSVNQCKYCSWGHTYLALDAGVDIDTIKAILAGDFKNLSEEELPALLFAQHYAETCGNPSKEAIKDLVKHYGAKKAKYILTVLRMIYFGNMCGNTIDAFESRIKGMPAEEGDWWFEFLLYILGGAVFKAIVDKIDPLKK